MATQDGHLGLNSVALTGNKTVAEADCGIAQVVNATATITLPSTVVGMVFIIEVGQTSTGAVPTVNVSPAALDKIMGNGFTSADNKDAIGAGRVGDRIVLVGDGVNGWFVQEVRGTWTREA
jgi:hypothetical protein